jgi:hypothetical protein
MVLGLAKAMSMGILVAPWFHEFAKFVVKEEKASPCINAVARSHIAACKDSHATGKAESFDASVVLFAMDALVATVLQGQQTTGIGTAPGALSAVT